MHNANLYLNSTDVIQWFNAVRNAPEDLKHRVLDAFWAGQIDSKCWLANTLNDHIEKESNIYIFGGWFGVLSSILFQAAKFPINTITSIDLDPICEQVANDVCSRYRAEDKFFAITANMKDYNYNWDNYPNIVINTSTEHINQETYNLWYQKVPVNSVVVLQGNNFFDCPEHVRCSKNLIDFKRQNSVTKTMYEGELPHDLYTRYMCIFKK